LPNDGSKEDEAVATAFDELVARGVLPGRTEPTISAEDLYRELGIAPPSRVSRISGRSSSA
jgi:hypothetical protein